MNYFQLYEAERKQFHVGARFIDIFNCDQLEITHISKYNYITLKHLNGKFKGSYITRSKLLMNFRCKPHYHESNE